ncbi:MAG: hypothetical protein E7399_08570 [Ruminococcaceae bacterium]|nr:hypothetical protein [Oscillospiraceae bacterium]
MKKILSVLLIGIMMLSFAACGGNKGEEINLMQKTWEGDDVKVSAKLYYSPESDILVENEEEKPYKTLITNEELNYKMEILLWEDTTFDNNKKSGKERMDTFTEFKVDKFDSYGYEEMKGYTAFVHLEEVSETTDRYMEVRIRKISLDEDSMEGAEFFENEEIRGIIDSLEYEGVVELPVEEEEEETEQNKNS